MPEDRQAISDAIDALQAAIAEHAPADEHGFPTPDDDIRWRLHVLACAITDMTFWVRRDPDHPGLSVATEIETGVSAWGSSDREALERYFAGDFRRPDELRRAESAPPSDEPTADVIMHRYVSGRNVAGMVAGGATLAITTDDETVADQAAAKYALRQGWKAPRVRRRPVILDDTDVLAVGIHGQPLIADNDSARGASELPDSAEHAAQRGHADAVECHICGETLGQHPGCTYPRCPQ